MDGCSRDGFAFASLSHRAVDASLFALKLNAAGGAFFLGTSAISIPANLTVSVSIG
jgi:hypothetical protein